MSGLYLVNGQDAVRAFGPDPLRATLPLVQSNLEELYLKRRGGGFNHDPAMNSVHDIFRGATSKNAAVQFCSTSGNPKGRKQNSEIVKVVGDFAEANRSVCHRIGFAAVGVGRHRDETIFIGLKAPFIRVRDSKAHLVIPGFRKTARPQGKQIDLLCSFAAQQLARDDYEIARPEYLYAGPGDDEARVFRRFGDDEVELFSPDQVDGLIQIYVEAVVRLLEAGVGKQPGKFDGYRIIDPSQGSLFGGA